MTEATKATVRAEAMAVMTLGFRLGFSLTFHKELSSSTGFAQQGPNNFLPKDAGYEKVHSLQA
jgi:hypothetical protein